MLQIHLYTHTKATTTLKQASLASKLAPKCQSRWHSPDIEQDCCPFGVIWMSWYHYSSKNPSFWKNNQNRALQGPETALNRLYHVVIFNAYVMKHQNKCLGMIFMKSHDILNKNYQKFPKKKNFKIFFQFSKLDLSNLQRPCQHATPLKRWETSRKFTTKKKKRKSYRA